jgi:hypothetical protein
MLYVQPGDCSPGEPHTDKDDHYDMKQSSGLIKNIAAHIHQQEEQTYDETQGHCGYYFCMQQNLTGEYDCRNNEERHQLQQTDVKEPPEDSQSVLSHEGVDLA